MILSHIAKLKGKARNRSITFKMLLVRHFEFSLTQRSGGSPPGTGALGFSLGFGAVTKLCLMWLCPCAVTEVVSDGEHLTGITLDVRHVKKDRTCILTAVEGKGISFPAKGEEIPASPALSMCYTETSAWKTAAIPTHSLFSLAVLLAESLLTIG